MRPSLKARDTRRRPAPRSPARGRGHVMSLAALALLLLLSAGLYAGLGAIRTREHAAQTIGGPFRLVDSRNRIVTDRDFAGHYLLVYFGYTECPDICPTTLGAVARAMALLGPKAARVQPLFITVDPTHDTPSVIGPFVAAFSPRLIGLTGSEAALQSAERAYHVIVRLGPGGIDHSAVLYLMAPDGTFLAPLPANSSAATIAADLTHYLG
jgi:cytochrome oxidase Cu insertion factor (SCO1/SenC/PrrC family)